jgi:hypothetical protein
VPILQVLVEGGDNKEGKEDDTSKEGDEAVLVHDDVRQKSNSNCSAMLGYIGEASWG